MKSQNLMKDWLIDWTDRYFSDTLRATDDVKEMEHRCQMEV